MPVSRLEAEMHQVRFIYLFIYTLFYVDIYNKKHKT